MALVLKSAGEFRRRVVVKSRMRRRFKIRQEIGVNNFRSEFVFFAPSRGVDAGQLLQDAGDSSRSRRLALLAARDQKNSTAGTLFCLVVVRPRCLSLYFTSRSGAADCACGFVALHLQSRPPTHDRSFDRVILLIIVENVGQMGRLDREKCF